MIKFSLRCDTGHAFESWFRDNAAFDSQVKRGFVDCPVCGSIKIEKAIMAPHVARTDRPSRAPTVEETPATPAPAPMAATNLTPEDRALRDMVRALRRHVEATADPVGPRFAEEALKMHQGEIAHRPIYGSSTPEDVAMLREEGVEFHPLPILPDDRN
jgi:hypothetical protein